MAKLVMLEAIAQSFESLADFDIYIAGRFEMAGAAKRPIYTK